MLSEEALNDSRDLADRLQFWRDVNPTAEIIDPISKLTVSSLVTREGSNGAAIPDIAATMKAFLGAVVSTDGSDTPFYKKSGDAGQICRLSIEWTDFFGNFGHSDELFIAASEAAAVLASFRYAIAQQVSFPDVHCILRRVRISQISLDTINEHGQKFYGEPDNFFEWNLDKFCTVADEGTSLSFDVATLVAASIYADTAAWVPPSYSAFAKAQKDGAVS